ncbi:MAG: arginine deiminase family protein, partial [Myxococcota bacterium]|nr:arginine deiminase family protein [Myxococcota bacterium]
QPDACFIEDRLVMGWGRGLLTHSRVPERRGESPSVAVAARAFVELTVMRPSGGLDGGDVIRLGDTLLVGLSERTDEAGVRALERWSAGLGVSVVPIEMASGLHLKCEATPLDQDTLLCVDGWPYRSALPGHVECVTVPKHEAYAANAIATEAGVLVAAGYPETAAAVAATGRRVVEVDVSAFRRADGSLTCLSVRFDKD